MESGINADQNFYSRRPHRSPDQNHQHQHIYETPPLPGFESRSPQLPPKLPFLTTQNLQAVTANTDGFGGVRLTGGGERDPDQFYRQYRGVESSSNGFADGMAVTASESRPAPSSLRSNGNGTTPKHPPLPAARTALTPTYRSASSPLDDRQALNNAKSTPALTGYSNSRQPSVKDLLRRFDQNNQQPSAAVPGSNQRINTRDASGAGYLKDRVGYSARTPANYATSAGNPRAGASTRDGRNSPASTRSTQRTRFAPEDQHSNNALSGVARATRTRNLVSGASTQASKSMVNLSPTSPNPSTRTRKPLFGEILPAGEGRPDVGYGMRHTAARRTSDSNLHPSWIHQRSKSDVDVSPSSPTAWYLGVTSQLDDVDTGKPRSTPGHNRNHSDFAYSTVKTMNGVNPSFRNINSPNASAVVPPSTRIPVPTKRLSNSSDSSSLRSTRANSPFTTTTKTLSNGKLRKPDQRPWSPAGRSITPSSPAKTPTRQSPRGKAKTPENISIHSSSLQAYIAAPPPKTSPPLRSSRPRRPVSSASTPATGQKPHGRSESPDKLRTGSPRQSRTGLKVTRNGESKEVNDTKSRKIPDLPLGKVDFAARRQQIQRAYTKSIHESEQKQIRADNLRRLQERQAKAWAQVSEPSEEIAHPEGAPEIQETSEPLQGGSLEQLHITTTFKVPDRGHAIVTPAPADQDSPTLGMPGTFVDDEPPQSAISCATEIDNEVQTEAPRFSRIPSHRNLDLNGISNHSGLSSHIIFTEDHLSPEQALFGMQHRGTAGESIQIMLDASPANEIRPDSTPTNDIFSKERDLSPSGSFHHEHYDKQYEQSPFEPVATNLSPNRTRSIRSRPTNPLESVDAQILANGDTQSSPGEVASLEHHLQAQVAPEIYCTDDAKYSQTPDSFDAPRLDFPLLRTALGPPSLVSNEAGQDYLNTPITDMEYESSDAGVPNLQEGEEPDCSRGENLAPRIYRESHRSSWTDDSVDTRDEYSGQDEYAPTTVSSDPEKKPTPPPKGESPFPNLPPTSDAYSPHTSSRFTSTNARIASPSRHHLPPLKTTDAFSMEFDQSPAFNNSVPIWPDYSPPPPPQQPGQSSPALSSRSAPPTSFYNRRSPSSLYQSSQTGAGRNPESRRASDDVYSPRASVSTPRSSTQISFEDSTMDQTSTPQIMIQTEEEKEFAESERKRLFQRKCVIKELIDTESLFVKDMNVVEEIYKGTAEACPKLDAADIKVLFRNTNEVVAFAQLFLDELKVASASVYSTRPPKSRQSKAANASSPATDDRLSIAATLTDETDDEKDRKTHIGAVFIKHLKQMQEIYADFLKNSEAATSRLQILQQDSAVKVWLSECNLVAKDLTAAWDLDALLVKPVQRITRYQLILGQLKKYMLEDHPDYDQIQQALQEVGNLLQNIDQLKKRINLVGNIVGRKRKESDVRSGLAKAFGRRADKLQSSNPNRPQDDEEYAKAYEKFSDDYLRLQVVLRDVEFYTREVTTFVTGFLRYLSAVELFVRMSASPYPELESKWARFNMSMRDMGTIALEDHISAIRKKVIEPYEKIIQLYIPPGIALKKRAKRRLDYEKFLATKKPKEKVDEKLRTQVTQYEALNDQLKIELPQLASKTSLIGKYCGVQFVGIQIEWYAVWQEKVRVVLEQSQMPKDVSDIVEMFQREYKYAEKRIQELGIINGTYDLVERDSGLSTRSSQGDDSLLHAKSRPPNLTGRSRGFSTTSDKTPSLPTPDFAKRSSGHFAMFSPAAPTAQSASQFAYSHQAYSAGHSRTGSGSPATPDTGSRPHASGFARPSTSRSYTSDSGMRAGNDYNVQHRRESGSTYNSASHHVDGPPLSMRPFSGVFNSAMPMPDGPEESQRSSRASSRDGDHRAGSFNVLYLAASLFEFNISATKSEAGYPYLTYAAGEIFDVIAEKGELWLAKNQDDESETVGWIWSKHFARLAAD